MLEFGERLYLFYARDQIGPSGLPRSGVGQEIWTTDGRTTSLLIDIAEMGFTAQYDSQLGHRGFPLFQLEPQNFRNFFRPFYSFSFGDKIYFPADDELGRTEDSRFVNYGVWQTDGTPEGTGPTGLAIQIDEALVVEEKLFFIANDDEVSSLYVATNGIENAQELGSFRFDIYSRLNPRLFEYGERLYFHADAGDGMKLWSTDGESEPIVSVLPNQGRRDAMPGEVVYDSTELTISATHKFDGNLSGCLPLDCPPDQWQGGLLFDVWMLRDGDAKPQFLAQIADAAGIEATLDSLSPDGMWAQVIKNQVFFRTLTSRETGNQMRFLMHAIELPELDETAHLAGDVDCDGSVGFADFLVLSDNFGRVMDAVWSDADFNGDRVVDFADFLSLSANFGIQAA